MIRNCCLLIVCLLAISCSEEDDMMRIVADPVGPSGPTPVADTFLRAADLSSLPELEANNTVLFNGQGQSESMLQTMAAHGVNAVRLRLWYQPTGQHSGFAEVRSLAERVRSMGMQVWLTVHYSDTWADPGHQDPPQAWQALSLQNLEDSVRAYTSRIMNGINPDIIQIGNEINSGFLWPQGHLIDQPQQALQLLDAAIGTVRDHNAESRIMLHFAGLEGAEWFYEAVQALDYDLIGLSYYPLWHGKDLAALPATMNQLSARFGKPVVLAETAYPFTLEWNDFTNNIVGLEEQLILPDYPATPAGQQAYLQQVRELISTADRGLGFCYWGGELVAFKGPQATDGSPWENQAFYDFDHKALPVLEVFRRE